MITLCYLYIKDYKCFKETDLLFDSRFVCQYDKDRNKLSIKYNNKLPENFWGAGIVSLTAIVGSNGAGKSTVLRQLLEVVTRGYATRHPDIVLVYIDANGTPAVYAGDSFAGLHIDETGITANIVDRPPTVDSILYRGHFYTYTKEDTWEGELAGEHNISEGWLLIKDVQNYENSAAFMLNDTIRQHLNAHVNEDAWRLCNFMLRRHDWEQMENYNPPRYINIVPNRSGDVRLQNNEFSKYRNEKLPANEDLPPHYEQMDSRAETLEIFIEEGFKNMIVEFPDNYKDYRKIWDDWLQMPQHDTAESLLSDFERLIERELPPLVNMQLRTLNQVLHEINAATFMETKAEYIRPSGIFYLDSNNVEGFKMIVENLRRQPVFATARFFDLFPSHFPASSCDLSSGEREALNLLSRLYSSLLSGENGYEYPTLILLDEAETSFHPEWQRRYIELLIQFFNQIPRVPAGHRFQIIYTTHSPITLSDIPENCVNYMKRDSEGECSRRINRTGDNYLTFGANVFDLYRDSFFMNDGLIGSFAERKIAEAYQNIDNNIVNNNIVNEDTTKLIELIGDRRIRNFLKNLLDNYEED